MIENVLEILGALIVEGTILNATKLKAADVIWGLWHSGLHLVSIFEWTNYVSPYKADNVLTVLLKGDHYLRGHFLMIDHPTDKLP